MEQGLNRVLNPSLGLSPPGVQLDRAFHVMQEGDEWFSHLKVTIQDMRYRMAKKDEKIASLQRRVKYLELKVAHSMQKGDQDKELCETQAPNSPAMSIMESLCSGEEHSAPMTPRSCADDSMNWREPTSQNLGDGERSLTVSGEHSKKKLSAHQSGPPPGLADDGAANETKDYTDMGCPTPNTIGPTSSPGSPLSARSSPPGGDLLADLMHGVDPKQQRRREKREDGSNKSTLDDFISWRSGISSSSPNTSQVGAKSAPASPWLGGGQMTIGADGQLAPGFNPAQMMTPKFSNYKLSDVEQYDALRGSSDEKEMSEYREALLSGLHRNNVDDRTVAWFLNSDNEKFWPFLLQKCLELDRRRMSPEVEKVRNPSAWLTKFFNAISRPDSMRSMSGAGNSKAEMMMGGASLSNRGAGTGYNFFTDGQPSGRYNDLLASNNISAGSIGAGASRYVDSEVDEENASDKEVKVFDPVKLPWKAATVSTPSTVDKKADQAASDAGSA